MRRLKRISFFLYSCLLFAVGFYGHYKIEQWFYPGRQTIISQNEIPFFQMQSATQAVSVPDRLRADTKLVVKNTDQVSRKQTEEIKSLPLRLIGCSRKEVEDEIRHYQDAPPLTELQQGLLRMELVSFSPQQIVVSKTYRKLQQAETFFLQIEENRVIVYEEDSRFYICRPRLTQEPCQAGSDGRFERLARRFQSRAGKIPCVSNRDVV